MRSAEGGLEVVCRHTRTLEQGCTLCLGESDWTLRQGKEAKPMSFEVWMERARKELSRQTYGGVDHEDDLPDFSWRDCYDEGMRPDRAVQQAIQAAGGF